MYFIEFIFIQQAKKLIGRGNGGDEFCEDGVEVDCGDDGEDCSEVGGEGGNEGGD